MKRECQSETGVDPVLVLEDVQRLIAYFSASERAVARSGHLKVVKGTAPEAGAPGESLQESGAPPDARHAFQLPTASQVRHQIRQRELRERLFDGGLVSDPIWGMLLELLLAHLEFRHVSIKQVSIASSTPGATALRHIHRLEQRALIRRYPDPFDRRRTYLALTDQALITLAKLFGRMRESSVTAIR